MVFLKWWIFKSPWISILFHDLKLSNGLDDLGYPYFIIISLKRVHVSGVGVLRIRKVLGFSLALL